jgi:hypothetical protein
MRPPHTARSGQFGLSGLSGAIVAGLTGLILVACGGSAESTAPAASPSGAGTPAAAQQTPGTPVAASADSAASVPTVIRRAPRTATPTAVDPLAAVTSKAVPGVPVPAAAELVESMPATADGDARADYRIEGVESDALSEWFSREMAKAGWGEPEERDGALVFVHDSELSERFAELGQKRTATVVFDLTDDVDFTLLVEAPKP